MAVAQRVTIAMALMLGACVSSYSGSARAFEPSQLSGESGWLHAKGVPELRQKDEADCGAAVMGMLVGYWSGEPADELADQLRPAPDTGIKAAVLRDYARRRGLESYVIEGRLADLQSELTSRRPVVVGLAKPQHDGVLLHYELVVAIHPSRREVVTIDPDLGWRRNSFDGFVTEWQATGHVAIVVLGPTVNPTPGTEPPTL